MATTTDTIITEAPTFLVITPDGQPLAFTKTPVKRPRWAVLVPHTIPEDRDKWARGERATWRLWSITTSLAKATDIATRWGDPALPVVPVARITWPEA